MGHVRTSNQSRQQSGGWRSAWVIVFCAATWGVAAAQTTADREAHQLAKDTLPQVLAFETILGEALERRDMKMFTEKFERPILRLQSRWLDRSYRSRGISDEVMDNYSDCSMAVIDLLQYGRAMLRDPNPDWASYALRRYREDLVNCRARIKSPPWAAPKFE